jgi:hypothetical protein
MENLSRHRGVQTGRKWYQHHGLVHYFPTDCTAWAFLWPTTLAPMMILGPLSCSAALENTKYYNLTGNSCRRP